MRVIGGKYRGRKLIAPQDEKVRPTTDKVKESVFDIIQFRVADCAFLDLFAGSGGMGIEAISRGANRVVFADYSSTSLKLLKSNLELINADSYVIRRGDYKGVLQSLKGEKFDIIYLDPPYALKCLEDCVQIISDNDLLNDGGILIYEHLNADTAIDKINSLVLIKSKKYGIIRVDIYERGTCED